MILLETRRTVCSWLWPSLATRLRTGARSSRGRLRLSPFSTLSRSSATSELRDMRAELLARYGLRPRATSSIYCRYPPPCIPTFGFPDIVRARCWLLIRRLGALLRALDPPLLYYQVYRFTCTLFRTKSPVVHFVCFCISSSSEAFLSGARRNVRCTCGSLIFRSDNARAI